MIDELTPRVPAAADPVATPETNATAAPTAPAAASTPPHPVLGILAEIETVLRDLDAIPSHIAAWVKSKLAEAKAKL